MRSLLILFTFAAVAGPCLAGQPVALKPAPIDADGVVTLGELFDGAGAAAATPVATRTSQSVVLDAGAVQTVARRAGLDWPNAEGYRRIIVRSGAAAASAKANVEVLTYARNLNAGEIVGPQDLVWGKAAAVPADAVSDASAAIGLQARRPLRAGAAALGRDLAAAQVIKTGDVVTVTWQDGGVSLSLQGKAAANAALGESFPVQNPASKKVVQALATGPGQALIGPAADRYQAARHPQFAAR
jgi:flagella basal body P-ring formation protein FlgA